jgi:hypothetical protein
MPINPIEPVWLKPVVTLRPVRGNLDTKHDRSPAKLEKTLRGQFGSFYDQKKIGNTEVVLRECAESQWCCGSAGIYNITQPETAARLQERKVGHVLATGAHIVATANPGCHLQLTNGLAQHTGNPSASAIEVTHPVVLLARAYAAEKQMGQQKG